MRRKYLALLPLAGGVSSMVQTYGGHRVRFDLEDGSGGGIASGGSETGGPAPSTDAAPAAPAEPMSIRDSLAAALMQQDGGESATPAAAEGVETGAKAGDGRVRNPDGTFAPKASDAAGKDAATGQPDAAGQQQAKPAAAPASVPEALTAAERETFAKLPAEAQAMVAQHVQQVANERRFYDQMAPSMQAVQHFAQRFQAHPAQVVAAWAQVQDNLSRDPVAAIKGLAQQFGVDLGKLGAPVQSQEDVYVDPQVAALQQQLASVQQFVQTQTQREQEAQRRQEEEVHRSVQTAVQEFAGTKDEAGQPKYPHFEAVRQHMAALLNAGAAKELADAYEQATWARPDLRQQLLAVQQQQAQQQRQEQQRQQAARARQASGSISGAPGGVAPPASPSDTSIRGLLAQAAGLA